MTMFICFYKKAIDILLTMDAVEVDMSFKRIRDGRFNEVIFSAFLHGSDKSMYKVPYKSPFKESSKGPY